MQDFISKVPNRKWSTQMFLIQFLLQKIIRQQYLYRKKSTDLFQASCNKSQDVSHPSSNCLMECNTAYVRYTRPLLVLKIV